MHASIVKSVLATYQIARDMNELIQKLSHVYASLAISALATYHTVSDMNELTQE